MSTKQVHVGTCKVPGHITGALAPKLGMHNRLCKQQVEKHVAHACITKVTADIEMDRQ